jgi:hypothetical protein
MADDLEVMLRNQVHANLTHALDSAVQAGDIKAAREATQRLQDFALKTIKSAPVQFTNTDIRAAIKAKASWFGVDPRRSAKAVEFGKNMEPESFKSAEDFAEAVIEAVEDEFEAGDRPDEEKEEKEEKEERKTERRKTDAPSTEGNRTSSRRTSGPWIKLADAPKEISDQIKSAAEKFTRNATKEQKDKYIATALGTAYAAAQRNKK